MNSVDERTRVCIRVGVAERKLAFQQLVEGRKLRPYTQCDARAAAKRLAKRRAKKGYR